MVGVTLTINKSHSSALVILLVRLENSRLMAGSGGVSVGEWASWLA